MPHPLFGVAASDLYSSGKGKVALLHKSVIKHDPTFGAHERQTTGDCVSHSTRNAVDVTRCHEIVGGHREEFVARGATEAILWISRSWWSRDVLFCCRKICSSKRWDFS